MRLVGDVRDDAVRHPADERLACARERCHVRRRAAADEDPSRRLGIAEPVGEPAQHLELDLARAGRLHPGARVDVRRARDQVAERAGPGAAAGDEGEEARVLHAAREGEDVLGEAPQDLVERLRGIRRRAAQPRPHLRGRCPPERRRVGVLQPVDEQVDGAVAELPHRLAADPQRILVQAAILPLAAVRHHGHTHCGARGG